MDLVSQLLGFIGLTLAQIKHRKTSRLLERLKSKEKSFWKNNGIFTHIMKSTRKFKLLVRHISEEL